ncbi:MAG: hypothetical protein OEV30_07300 [Ignavibacteria bacterium]|nr:hypothetical protein [Ignavibacteria bacterium]
MIRARIRPLITGREELPNGIRLYAARSESVTSMFRQFIAMEEECCSFLTFSLSLGHRIRLDILGPEGAKAFIAEELEL